MANQPRRAEVAIEQTWNLADIYPSRAEWEAELTALADDLVSVTQYQGRIAAGPDALLACLQAQEEYDLRLGRVIAYADLCLAADGTDPLHQADAGRAHALATRRNAAFSFIRSELLALPPGALDDYLAREPGLAQYRCYLEEVAATRPYALLPETEQALAALDEVLRSPLEIYQRATSADVAVAPVKDQAGRTAPVSLGTYEFGLQHAPDTVLRRRAFAALAEGLGAYQHTLAHTLATEIKKNVALARLRGYPSTAHMLLQRAGSVYGQPQAVSVELYESVLDIIQSELAPHMRRLARLRRRVLGLDHLLHCDLQAPLDPAYQDEISFAAGADLIEQSLDQLGPEYCRIIAAALRQRWIDRAENAGKLGGAFCKPVYGVHPYILTRWTGNLKAAFVLTHELGHAAHLALSDRHQRLLNARLSDFFIEAPSTLNELLLGEHIRAAAGDVRMARRAVLQLIATYHHNFVTHLLEGELLRRLYARAEQGKGITAAVLGEEKGAILARFWGDTLEVDDAARLVWLRQPHYYVGLYPYTYAAGLAAATAVLRQIQTTGAAAARNWVEVLKAGSTKTPLQLLRMVGVDLAQPEPLRQAVAFVGELVDWVEQSFAAPAGSP